MATRTEVYRSRLALAVVAAGWVGAGVFLTLIGVVVATGGTRRSDLLVVGAPVVALACLAAVWSARRVSLRVDSEGIEVRNVFRNWRFAWDGLEEVGIGFFAVGGRVIQPGDKRPFLVSGSTPPGLGFRLRDGRQVSVATATVYLSWSMRERLLMQLGEGLLPYGVEVLVKPEDLE